MLHAEINSADQGINNMVIGHIHGLIIESVQLATVPGGFTF